MIFDDHGNAIGSYETFARAAEVLKELVEEDYIAKDECAIFEYDENGHVINACKYEDLL